MYFSPALICSPVNELMPPGRSLSIALTVSAIVAAAPLRSTTLPVAELTVFVDAVKLAGCAEDELVEVVLADIDCALLPVLKATE
jgi:hypothetical protein